MNSIVTVLFYGIAIIHCLTDRVIAPYLQAIFNELAGETPVTATATADVMPVLTVAEPPAKAPATTTAPAKPRAARRRKSTAKVAA